MIYQMTWDSSTGYIKNDTYPNGYEFDSKELKPVLPGVDYESLDYDEYNNVFNFTIDGTVNEMTTAVKAVVLGICMAWTDVDYIAPAFETQVEKRKELIEVAFIDNITKITIGITSLEIASWTKQEEEARAWVADNSAVTPMVDILLTARNLNETKAEFVDKIISKADHYVVVYAGYLGRLQSAMHLIDAATTEADLDEITF